MLLTPVLFVHDTGSDQAFARVAAFHKAHPAFSADFTVSIGRGTAHGQMLCDRNLRTIGHLTAPGVDYKFSSTPDAIVEVNYSAGNYDEHSGFPRAVVPPSRITGLTKGVPGWILASNLHQAFPGSATFKSTGKEVDSGQSCDTMRAQFKTQMMTIDVDLAIDPAGIVRRYKSVASGMGPTTTIEWRFSRVEPVEHLVASAFHLAPPLGFVPFSLPSGQNPTPIGHGFPTAGWHATTGGELDLKARLGGHGGLVAILAPDSEPSRRAGASLTRLHGNVPLVTLSDSNRPLSGADGFDPSGKLILSVGVEYTPMFALLDGSGKIKRLWMGYDPDHAAQFEAEVRGAYKGS